MTQIFSDGFESGDFSAWTSTTGTPVVQSVVKHHGTYCAESDASGDYYRKDYTEQTTVFHRVYLRFSVLPANNEYFQFMRMGMGATEICSVQVRRKTDGTLILRLSRNYPASASFDYSYTWVVNTWYCIEVKFVRAVSGEYKVWLDGTEVITNTGVNTTGVTGASRIVAGWNSGSVAAGDVVWIDCVVVADAYIGPEAGAVLKEVTDTLSLSDVSFAHKTFAVPDLVGLLDAAPLTNRTLPLGDAISLADQVWRDKAFAVTDGVSLSELVERILAVVLASAIVLEGEKGVVTLHGESGVVTLEGEKGEVTL